MPTVEVIRKALTADITAAAKGFKAVVSAETIDRDGEVLIVQGCNATEFMQNPVLFWNHEYDKPVGKCVNLKRIGDTLVGEFEFARRPEGMEGEFFPEVAASLVAQGVVNAVSVGYVPEDGGVRRANGVDKKRYGDGVHTVFSRWKLLEISLAPLQANPDALITAVRKGVCSSSLATKMFGVIVPPRRIQVSVEVPPNKKTVEVFVASTPTKKVPISVKALVGVELARAKGRVWLD
jgi:HK97 family phage prohead protease